MMIGRILCDEEEGAAATPARCRFSGCGGYDSQRVSI